MDGSKRALEEIISPYLDIKGVRAAALVSTDGLLVASASKEMLDLDAMSAHTASALSLASELSADMGFAKAESVILNLLHHALILAPLTKDLFLVIIGSPQIQKLIKAESAA